LVEKKYGKYCPKSPVKLNTTGLQRVGIKLWNLRALAEKCQAHA
jgi:hypothetical protein